MKVRKNNDVETDNLDLVRAKRKDFLGTKGEKTERLGAGGGGGGEGERKKGGKARVKIELQVKHWKWGRKK